MGNWFKTTLLLGAMTALIVFIGQLFGGKQGMIIAFALAMGMNFFSYWFSDKIVLSMHRAQEIGPDNNPGIYNLVREIAISASLPMPRVYLIPQDSPNAFATGRDPDHSVIAVTEGLLGTMDNEELKGVIAHEMAHIKNRDILIGSIAATMAGAVMILASIARWSAIFGGGSGDDDEEGGALGFAGLILMSIIAPLAAMIIQMAISRSREYLADATGARLAGNPLGLANALEKLGAYTRKIPLSANPSTAHMFIVNPLSGGAMMNLFSTHPPLEQRIASLRGEITGNGALERGKRGGRKEAEDFWRHISK
jgi:heat shock protein HtpX